MSSVLPQLILQVILIAFNAVFAAAEIAIISMNDAKLEVVAKKGDKRAKRLAKITSKPARFLSTIQVAITLAGFLGSAFAADNFSEPLVDLIMKTGISESRRGLISSVSVILITLVLSFFTIVFGELVPKRIAMKKTESLALGISGFIAFISKLFAPIVWLLSLSTNGVLRLCRIDPNEEDETASEEEIRMMIDVGSEKGTIGKQEKELLQNVFEFDDTVVSEIATHRTQVDILSMDDPVEEWEEIIHKSRHTFYPVCGDTVDTIIGVLNAKDYFRLKNKSKDNVLNQAVKKAYLVPDTVRVDILFKNMKAKSEQFAVVVDEYGGMEGVVTFTDILECLVGEFDEDTLAENGGEPDIKKIDDNTWQIWGTALIEDVEEELDIHLGCEDCETFGGYVLSILGAVPADGATPSFETEQLSVKVESVQFHRIEKTIVCKLHNEDEEEDDDDEKSESLHSKFFDRKDKDKDKEKDSED